MNGPSRSVSSCTTSLTAGSHGSTPVPGGAHAWRMTSCFSPRAKRTGAVTYPPTPTVIEPVTRGPVRCSAARRGSGNAAVAVCRLKHAFAELAQARPAVQRTYRRHAAIPCSATFPVKGGELAGAVGDLAAAVCWQGTAQNPTQSSAGSVQVKRRQANCKTAPPLRNAALRPGSARAGQHAPPVPDFTSTPHAVQGKHCAVQGVEGARFYRRQHISPPRSRTRTALSCVPVPQHKAPDNHVPQTGLPRAGSQVRRPITPQQGHCSTSAATPGT